MNIFDLIFPKSCLSCSSVDVDENGIFCFECWKRLVFIQRPLCVCCGLPFPFDLKEEMLCLHCQKVLPAFNQARSIFVYNDIIKRPILRLKHFDQTQYAKAFAKILSQFQDPIDCIIPIPLHWTRLFIRQYNQAGLIAHHLGKLIKKPVLHNAIKRAKKTHPQKKQSRGERFENLKEAFELNIKSVEFLKNKTILLVDDVMTTGSTFHEASIALRNAKVKSILCLTIARSVPGFLDFEKT